MFISSKEKKISNIFLPSSKDNKINLQYLDFFYPESYKFLYNKLYTKKREYFKIITQIVSIKYSYSKNEFYTTLYNGIKTFIQFDLKIIRPLSTFKQEYPLTKLSLIKKKFKDLFFYTKNFIFKSPNDNQYRTIYVRARPPRREYNLVGFNHLTRPRNKIVFFNIITSLKKFSFKYKMLFRFRNRRRLYLHIFYLGFHLRLKIKKESRKKFYRNFYKILSRRKFIRKVLKRKTPFSYFKFKENIFLNIKGEARRIRRIKAKFFWLLFKVKKDNKITHKKFKVNLKNFNKLRVVRKNSKKFFAGFICRFIPNITTYTIVKFLLHRLRLPEKYRFKLFTKKKVKSLFKRYNIKYVDRKRLKRFFRRYNYKKRSRLYKKFFIKKRIHVFWKMYFELKRLRRHYRLERLGTFYQQEWFRKHDRLEHLIKYYQRKHFTKHYKRALKERYHLYKWFRRYSYFINYTEHSKKCFYRQQVYAEHNYRKYHSRRYRSRRYHSRRYHSKRSNFRYKKRIIIPHQFKLINKKRI